MILWLHILRGGCTRIEPSFNTTWEDGKLVPIFVFVYTLYVGRHHDRSVIAAGSYYASPHFQFWIGFYNASENYKSRTAEELTQWTGTPMFIAIEISGGHRAHEHIYPLPLIASHYELLGKAYKNYINTYGYDMYDKYNAHLQNVEARTILEVDSFLDPNTKMAHQPLHDVKSIFWIIIWFLIRAKPENSSSKVSMHYLVWANTLLDHKIVFKMGRIGLLETGEEEWAMILYSCCKGLVLMVRKMGTYFRQCWMRYPSVPVEHAYETFKCLLLTEIVRMTEEGNPIPIQGLRYLPQKDSQAQVHCRIKLALATWRTRH
ncbi:hypothetical protein M422DRAFT_46441 [Sphaerobolus stellatus SS14]|uniref:Uncharacterized protein n=1 Tax=Sphaerobolus stellatus (strain SS14) TaxID=990650 RepID=A0A0C9VFV1_SPHS4|nr:hypothetical protein M422DRAFT_46441 [Sphaerobolus stellatus SS14]